MRAIPDVLYGVTLDDVVPISDIVASAKALCRMPTHRIVFDELVLPGYYRPSVTALQPVSFLMGELLDSYYVKTYTRTSFSSRVKDYLAAFKDSIDIWEVANEVNGEWLGKTADVVYKMTDAFSQVKKLGLRAAVTFYYNPDCWLNKTNEMFTWIKTNVPSVMRTGLDYVFISYYEDGCNLFRPTPVQWQKVFQDLRVIFPSAKLGFGEVGFDHPILTSELTVAQGLLKYYYGLPITVPGYVGGYFWWNYIQDCTPYQTRPLWPTLNDAFLTVV